MRASDIQISLPMVERSQSAAEAGRVVADTGRIGVVVAAGGLPIGMISVTDLFRLALPEYLLTDPSLAATLDEQSCVELIRRLAGKSVGEAVDDGSVRLRPVPEVDADASLVEIAAVLASAGSTIAVIAGTTGSDTAFVTLPTTLDAILKHADRSGNGAMETGPGGPA